MSLPATTSKTGSRHLAGVLQVEKVGVNDKFFDLRRALSARGAGQGKLREALQHELCIVELFRYPTIGALAAHLSHAEERVARQPRSRRGQRPSARLGAASES